MAHIIQMIRVTKACKIAFKKFTYVVLTYYYDVIENAIFIVSEVI